MEIRKKFYIPIIIILLLIEILSIFLMYKSMTNKTLEIVESKKTSNYKLAILLEQNDGTYKENTTTLWPKDLEYNNEKSGCLDKDGNKLSNVLTYNSDTNIATVNTKTTCSCYLYFDLPDEAPRDFTFYIGGSENPSYATSLNTTIYLSWVDTDIASYCISAEESSANCSWNSVTGTSITTNYTLPDKDGGITLYSYIKDNGGNVSGVESDGIILDRNAPYINSVTKTSDEKTSITVKISASDIPSGMKAYYYQLGSNSVISSKSNTYTFTGLTPGTSYTIKAYAEDNAGNKSEIKSYTFSTKINTASETLLASPPTGLNTTMEAGLYRYQGTTANNYICFGTSTKSTCTGNTDQYMYRIIGINASGQLKLIKKESFERMEWWNNSNSSVYWVDSEIVEVINGSEYLEDTTYYVPSGWADKIATTTWKYHAGGVSIYNTTTPSELYNIENSYANSYSTKIALMYLHDYYYAVKSGGEICTETGGDYEACKASWINFTNNDDDSLYTTEWTMTSSNNVPYNIWAINSDQGYINHRQYHNEAHVRPVFYLTSDVQLLSGTGTISDPFIITW